MKLLYGTTNPAKLQHMKEMLDGLGLKNCNNENEMAKGFRDFFRRTILK